MRRKLEAALLLGAVSVLAPSLGWAQANPGASGSSVSEVVVTATKLGATALSRTAVSADVVTGDKLEQLHVQNAEDLMHTVSGVVIDQGSSTPKVAIRGVSFDNFQIQAENGVATYVDGIVIERSQAQIGAFYDLDRVDVLKGPQGSSFGRNATGGAINYITRKPVEGWHGELEVGGGSFGHNEEAGVLNYGAETFGIRLAGQHDQDDGYVTNLVDGKKLNGHDNYVGKVALTWRPIPALSLDYLLQYVDSDSTGPAKGYVTPADAAYGAALIAADHLTVANPAYPLTMVATNNYDVVNSIDPLTNFTSVLQGLTARYRMGAITLNSITGFLQFREQWTADVAVPSNTTQGDIRVDYFRPASEQFSEELFLNGVTGRLSWVVGGYYLREQANDNTRFSYNLPGCDPFQPAGARNLCSLHLDNAQLLESYAGYVSGQFKITDRLRLDGGFRYTHDSKQASGKTGDFILASSGGITFPGMSLAGISTSSNAPTGDVGLEYDLNSETFTYVKYSRGYKAGGINNNSGVIYNPEYIDAYEIGIKGRLLGNSLRYSTSGFYSDYKNIQVYIENLAGNPTPDIFNAARARILGVDVDATWQANRWLSFDAAYTWMPVAKYTDFSAIDPINGLTNFSGVRLDRAPRFSGVAGVNLSIPVGEPFSLTARLEDFHTSSVVYNEAVLLRPAGNMQNGHDLLNAYLTVGYQDRVDLRLYGKNLTNTFYLESLVETSGTHNAEFGRPREFGAELRYHW